MTMSSDVIIRKARDDDYDAIKGFGMVHDGKDFLQDYYLQFLNDPDIYAVVAEVKGQVVGFYMNQLIDGGFSVIKRGARVHPSYRKMGIMHDLSEALDQWLLDLNPQPSYSYVAISDKINTRAANELAATGYKEVIQKTNLNLAYQLSDLTTIISTQLLPEVITLGYDDVKLLFSLDHIMEKLFPNKQIFYCFIGYRCLESNIKHFTGDRNEVCVTTTTSSSHMSDSPTQTLFLLQDLDVLTLSHWFVVDDYLVYVMDISCAGDPKISSLEAHVKRHVGVLKSMTQFERGLCLVIVKDEIMEEKVRMIFNQYGISKNVPNAERKSILFEKILLKL